MNEVESDDWDWLIDGLRSGDNTAISAFMDQFGAPLERIAAGRITPQLAKRFGPQSVALSVCRTFVRRSAEGLFELEDGDAMWRLLCVITLTKIRERVRYHRRERRDVSREIGSQASGDDDPTPQSFARNEATPAKELEFADTLEHLIAGLDQQERRLLELKMQNVENDAIAEEFRCAERTVRRMLGRLQAKFEAELDVG